MEKAILENMLHLEDLTILSVRLDDENKVVHLDLKWKERT